MPRRKSTDICPKCKRPGYESYQWSRRNYYVYSDKTSVKRGTWMTDAADRAENLELKASRKYRIQSNKYYRRYFIHYDSHTKRQKKCYVNNIPQLSKEYKPGSIIYPKLKKLTVILQEVAKLIKECPPDSEDDKKLGRMVNDYLEIFKARSRPPRWWNNLSKKYAKYGMDINDQESIRKRMNQIPIAGLIDIMMSIPIVKALVYHRIKYVNPKLEERQKALKEILSEGAF